MKTIHLPSEDIFFSFMTDIHLSARAPGRRTDSYKDSILRKIRFVREFNNRANGLCLCGGDFFHVKNPLSPANPKGLISEVMDDLREFNTGTIYGLVGNHDIQYDRHETLSNQPLGVLSHAGVYTVLEGNTRFISKDGTVVEVVPFHYDEDMNVLDKILASGSREKGVDFRIGMGHAMARQGGAQEHFGHPIIGYDLLDGIDFDVFLWGHDHSRIEPIEVGICTHFHPGSLSRASLSAEENDREVTVLGLKFTKDGWGYKEKMIPVEPLNLAFKVGDRKLQKIQDSSEIKQFVQGIQSSLGAIETSDPLSVMTELCGKDEKLLELCLEVCEF